jgi:hypothetical protein
MDSRNVPLRFIAHHTGRYHAQDSTNAGLRRLYDWDTLQDIRDRTNRSLIDLQFPKDGSGVL